jgi:hypothetical protein
LGLFQCALAGFGKGIDDQDSLFIANTVVFDQVFSQGVQNDCRRMAFAAFANLAFIIAMECSQMLLEQAFLAG